MRDDMDGVDVFEAGECLADLFDTVASRIEQETGVRALSVRDVLDDVISGDDPGLEATAGGPDPAARGQP